MKTGAELPVVAVGAERLHLRADIERIEGADAGGEPHVVARPDRGHRGVGRDHRPGDRLIPEFEAGAHAVVAAAQAGGRIVGRQAMGLAVVAEEHRDGDVVAHEPPAGQDRGAELAADHGDVAERAGVVLIEPAAEHQLEHGAVAVEAARRPQHAAIGEAALAPDVGGGEQQPPPGIRHQRRGWTWAARAGRGGRTRPGCGCPGPRPRIVPMRGRQPGRVLRRQNTQRNTHANASRPPGPWGEHPTLQLRRVKRRMSMQNCVFGGLGQRGGCPTML